MSDQIEKIPPQSLEAEMSLLGSILIDKDAMLKVADIVRTEDFYKERLSKDNVFAREEKKLESLILEYTRKMRGNKFDFRSTNVTIPVVVHVVYNNATQNVSDAQIQSQIDVLNRDYRRLSAEIPGGPAAFTGWLPIRISSLPWREETQIAILQRVLSEKARQQLLSPIQILVLQR